MKTIARATLLPTLQRKYRKARINACSRCYYHARLYGNPNFRKRAERHP